MISKTPLPPSSHYAVQYRIPHHDEWDRGGLHHATPESAEKEATRARDLGYSVRIVRIQTEIVKTMHASATTARPHWGHQQAGTT